MERAQTRVRAVELRSGDLQNVRKCEFLCETANVTELFYHKLLSKEWGDIYISHDYS